MWLKTRDGIVWNDDEDIDYSLYAPTGQTKWKYDYLPAIMNSQLDVYVAASVNVKRDIGDLKQIAVQTAQGRPELSKIIGAAVWAHDNDLVDLRHKEERAEATASLLTSGDALYRVDYKTNDSDRPVRLSFLLHELVHIDADQRYKYHADNAVHYVNAHGDESSSKNDKTAIGKRLGDLDEKWQNLSDAVDELEEGEFKTHLRARRDRAAILVNEWDTVVSELLLYLHLSAISATTKLYKVVLACAEDARKERHKSSPRKRTPRPGGRN